MTDHTTWVYARNKWFSDFIAFNPLDDETGTVVRGLTLITTLERLIADQGATRVYAVDDLYLGGNPTLVYDAGAVACG